MTATPVLQPGSTTMPLSCRQLGMRYGSMSVFSGINLEIASGEVVGLIGRNGSGKSTLIRALLGMIEVEKGKAFVFGEPSLLMSDRAKERLAYVPQQPSSLAWMEVGNMFAYFARFYPNWDAAYVATALRDARIPSEKPLGKLSPGERQRVELIRALAFWPELLVLDEPAAALDPAARRDLLRNIALRAGEGGTTVLFSTHIVSDLERVASRIIFLNQERIALDVAVDDLKERFARVIIRSDLLPSGKITAEIHRRLMSDGMLSMVIERMPGEDWPAFAREAALQFQVLGLEDLFVEIAE